MPDPWTETNLEDLARIVMGQSPGFECINCAENGLPFLQGCAEFGLQVPVAQVYCSPPLRVAKSGSILMSVRAPVGTTNWADQDYCIGRGLSAIHGRPTVADTRFLLYAIRTKLDFLHRRSQGSTFLAVGSQDVLRFPVPVVGLSEQRRIAEILSTLDEAIEQTEALIAKYQQIKTGLMHDLFTRGLTPDGHLRPTRTEAPHLYKQSPLGWIPCQWEAIPLKEILRRWGGYLQTGPFGSQLHSYEYQLEGIPVVMPQDISGGQIDTAAISRITERRANELGRHRMKIGDIVIARRGDLSRACAISEENEGWVCGTGCFLLRLGANAFKSNFAALVYRHWVVQQQLAGLSVGTTMPSLNNSVMEKLKFTFCDPEEQLMLTSRLDDFDNVLEKTKAIVASARKIKSGLMQDLLTGRVRVPLPELTTA